MNKSKLMLLALASTALAAAPAAATTDHAGYVGIEAGLLFPNDSNVSFDSNYNYDFVYDYDFDVGYKMGFDGDIIGGYDFGQFRAELELGYKTASVDDIGSDFLDQFVGINTDGDVSVWSLMVNGLWNPSTSAVASAGRGQSSTRISHKTYKAQNPSMSATSRTMALPGRSSPVLVTTSATTSSLA